MSIPTPLVQPADMDDELTALMLQLEECDVYCKARKGKYPAGQKPDEELVCDKFYAELHDYKTFLEDRKLAQSIGAAVHSDSRTIVELSRQEAQATEDHRLAVEMSHNNSLHANGQDSMFTLHGGTVAESVTEFSDEETEVGSFTTYVEHQADVLNKLSEKLHCCACTDRYPRASIIITKCSHQYCISCIKSLFMQSTNDESLYPPRCCKQPIPLALVAEHMTAEERAIFELSVVEYSTRNRTYCSNRECSRFLVPTSIEASTNRVVCPACATETCALCKNAYHSGQDCSEDAAIQETRDLARSMGWQTCHACDRVVILRSGCNHMTCHCKAEFCYICGVPWKQCKCETVTEDRLIERAEEIVQRNAEPNIQTAERQRRVNEVFNNLRENHECQHPGRLERITDGAHRGFQCELCNDRLYEFILQCRRCNLTICDRCRRNRI